MKRYKPLYGMTFVMLLGSIVLSLLFAIFISEWAVKGTPPAIPLTDVLSLAVICVLLLGVLLIVNLVAHALVKKWTWLDENCLIHCGTTVSLCRVTQITLHLGRIGKYTGSTPNQLAVSDGTEDADILIDRPSLPLILRLRRLCPNATFRVTGWGVYLLCPVIAVAVIVIKNLSE